MKGAVGVEVGVGMGMGVVVGVEQVEMGLGSQEESPAVTLVSDLDEASAEQTFNLPMP